MEQRFKASARVQSILDPMLEKPLLRLHAATDVVSFWKAVPGVMALLPRGIPHGFTNVGNKPSRLLDTILPGQFDNYFVELADLFTRGEPSQEQNDALSRKYRIKYL